MIKGDSILLSKNLGRLPSKLTSKRLGICLALLGLTVVLWRSTQLLINGSKPVDALLVLGGTPFRERYAARLAKENPHLKVLVSGGSEDPCIWLIFKKADAPMENVWMERTSQNTLENFIYSTPILQKLGVCKVSIVTDEPQATRAMPMGRVILGAHGIVAELKMTPHSGGEQTRFPLWSLEGASVVWALVSQVYNPMPKAVTHLPDVDMEHWYKVGFYCSPQADVDDFRRSLSGQFTH